MLKSVEIPGYSFLDCILLAAIPSSSLAGQHQRLQSMRFVRANVKTLIRRLLTAAQSYPRSYRLPYRYPRYGVKISGHIFLPWIHRVVALMKRCGLGLSGCAAAHRLRISTICLPIAYLRFRPARTRSKPCARARLSHHPTSLLGFVGREHIPRKGVS